MEAAKSMAVIPLSPTLNIAIDECVSHSSLQERSLFTLLLKTVTSVHPSVCLSVRPSATFADIFTPCTKSLHFCVAVSACSAEFIRLIKIKIHELMNLCEREKHVCAHSRASRSRVAVAYARLSLANRFPVFLAEGASR